MRSIYGRPEQFRESLATPTAIFPEIVNGIDRMKVRTTVQNLKLVALSVSEIIAAMQELGATPGYAV